MNSYMIRKLLAKLFLSIDKTTSSVGSNSSRVLDDELQRSRNNARELSIKNRDRVYAMVKEVLNYYNTVSCQCAYPRFIQYTSIDCRDYDGTFFVLETEAFIEHAFEYFDVSKINNGEESIRSIYTCKKCKSTFEYGWSDFSIAISRAYLKPIQIMAIQIGAEADTPIPVVMGLCGHKLRTMEFYDMVTFDDFLAYIYELK
ncbi:hypothetical protein ACFOG5_11520 [Pedobacter fastidiosus]|uniref:Uncharacterized protein n=1 Tax=Pedobacter fastidiosus TaxID=2765361 RepID=A0ABR7KXV5_9SPHI|nr:hypothetical protein [Pedobacter fastidiosus]MBC6112640.1 hypothetical protein [Pedobacter fastidiosus]